MRSRGEAVRGEAEAGAVTGMAIKIGYSDLCLSRIEDRDIEWKVEALIQHGADSVEILMNGAQWRDIDQTAVRLSRTLPAFGIGYSVHPPTRNTNLTSGDGGIRDAALEKYQQAIFFAGEIGAEYVVIHPGLICDVSVSKREAVDMAAASISSLREYAGKWKVKLAVENVGDCNTSIFTVRSFIDFVVSMGDNVGYLIDTGHAFINRWDIPGLIRKAGNKLMAIHLHDNDGREDDHLAVGEGAIDWAPVFAAIKETTHNPHLVLEYRPGVSFAKLRESKGLIMNSIV